jgi:predicted DNA-binding transcriptional regulator YafY
MDRLQRLYRLHGILKGRRYPVPRQALLDELACSSASLTRLIAELRDLLGAPIEYEREAGGYRYSHDSFELPGLWFTPGELTALFTAQKLLAEAQPGLLDSQLAPLRGRIEAILAQEHLGAGELGRRVRILRMAARPPDTAIFQTVAGATARRRRLKLRYHARDNDAVSERPVSPQRLIHYRDNWYLDAWCHQRNALRSFALDRIRAALALDSPALDIPDADLDAHFAGSYGIFAGAPTHTATLRFTPERARWVAEERWHPRQQGRWLEDGRFELAIPYADPRELIMDILKYGPDVEVVAPDELRAEVARRLQAGAAQYHPDQSLPDSPPPRGQGGAAG